jgi:autotransporter-associated beta strand protein
VLYASTPYTGATTVDQGWLYAYDDHSFGATSSGTTVSGSGAIKIDDANVGDEPLTLARTASGVVLLTYGACGWAGDVVLSKNAEVEVDKFMNFSGGIGGSAGLTKKGEGDLIYSGSATNTYAGDTQVDEGALLLDKSTFDVSVPGNLYIGDGIGGADSDVVRLLKESQIPDSTRIVVATSGLFDLNNKIEYFGALEGGGHVALGSGNIGVGRDNSSSVYAGLINGSGELLKYGSGTLTLTRNNTYSGDTRINNGTLLINGSQPSSDVLIFSYGTLGGIGTVGVINSGGTVRPGASVGQLSCENILLQSASTFGVELNGYTSSDYDRIDASGSVTLDNTDLSIAWGFVPAVGDSFTILDNDGTDAVAGTFNGLAEGASVVAGNVTLQVSYVGGTGNDVVLSATAVEELEPLRIKAYTTIGGYVEMEWVGGVPPYVVEKKTALTNSAWQAATAPTRDMATMLPAVTTNGFYRVTGGN